MNIINPTNKPRFVISCPFDTYSGYGARSRDLVKAIIETNKYQVELLPQKWGETSWGFCDDHKEWAFLKNHQILQMTQKPDIWMQITIPNEFTPVGKYNIGCTAGIEADGCKPEWVEGLNRMDMNWVSSNFAKQTFENVSFEKKSKANNQVIGEIKLTKPIKVIFEGANLDIYKSISTKEIKTIDLTDIKEDFCFLFVGHWMNGDYGHDRKNVGVMVRTFFESFKNKKNKPALILKASTGIASYMSRDMILDRILQIRQQIPTKLLPNIYVLSGEFDDSEMNELYNHPKIKAMISLTKGEGFGRPLLEFSLTGKPIIASGWSGHTDFLNKDYVSLVGGVLENVHPSAVNNWLIKEARWFKADPSHAGGFLKDIYKNYKVYHSKAKRQKYYAKENFSWDAMKNLIDKELNENIPEFPKQVPLNLPNLNLPTV